MLLNLIALSLNFDLLDLWKNLLPLSDANEKTTVFLTHVETLTNFEAFVFTLSSSVACIDDYSEDKCWAFIAGIDAALDKKKVYSQSQIDLIKNQ